VSSGAWEEVDATLWTRAAPRCGHTHTTPTTRTVRTRTRARFMAALACCAAGALRLQPALAYRLQPALAHDGVPSRRRAAGAFMSSDDEASVSDDEAESSEALLVAFARRVQEDGGSTSVRELQLSALKKDAGKAVGDAGQRLNRALDLDGQAAQAPSGGRRVTVGTGGVLETGGWRATVAFGLLTILLAFYAALTTDFGDGGTDAGLCMGDVKLCTREEIENSRIAEIVAKNR